MPLLIRSITRALARVEITGPTSVLGSCPALTFKVLVLLTSSSTQCLVSPTSTATESAIQRCPAAPKAAPTKAFKVCSLLASGITTTWFFAPIIDCTRLPCCPAKLYTCVPTAVEPTKEIALISRWLHRRSTTSLPPCTTFSTPAGTPASIASSTSIMVDNGSCSEGFKTKVLPQTIAIGNIHSGIIAGKLNGVIPAHTPKGCCKV